MENRFKLFQPSYGKDLRGFANIPKVGGGSFKVYDLRDTRIEVERQRWQQAGNSEDTLRLLGFEARDSAGNYMPTTDVYKGEVAKLVSSGVGEITVDPATMDAEEISNLLRSLPRDKKFLISQGNTTYTANDEMRNKLSHSLVTHQDFFDTSSEQWMAGAVKGGTPFTISMPNAPTGTQYKKKSGAFFNHVLKQDLSDEFAAMFEPLQIWKKLPDTTRYIADAGVSQPNDLFDFGMRDEHYSCLIKALLVQGCSIDTLHDAKQAVTGLFVPKAKLMTFASIAKIRIRLSYYKKRGGKGKYADSMKIASENHWDEKDPKTAEQPLYDVAFIDDHYISLHKTEICRYGLANYDELKGVDAWWEYTERNKKKPGRGLSTLEVVHYMLENRDKWFDDIPNDDAFMSTLHFDKRKNREYEGEMRDQYTPEEIEEHLNDPEYNPHELKFKAITKHITSCEFKVAEGLYKDMGYTCEKHPVAGKVWTPPDRENSRPDDFDWEYCFNAPKKHMTIAWDTETCTDGDIHKRYTSNFYCPEFGAQQYETEYNMLTDLMEKMIDLQGKKKKVFHVRILAHNAGYDLRSDANGILSCLTDVRMCETDGAMVMMSGTFMHNGKKLKVKLVDTMRFIVAPLKKFPSMFKLGKVQKEIMPYHMFNEKNMFNYKSKPKHDGDEPQTATAVPLKVLAKAYPTDKKMQAAFEENCKNWECIDEKEGTVDLRKYSNRYCDIDCRILYDGMRKFRSDIFKITGLDIDTLYTAAGIAETFMTKEGVFDGVEKAHGVTRDFIQKCVVGGRVCMSDNKPKVVDEDLCDADATSLYPSAMVRLLGYVMGFAKGIKAEQLANQAELKETMKDVDMYYVRIRIDRVGKHYKTPLLSYVDENGTRQWDDTTATGRCIYVDKIGLEGMVQFHDIDYTVIAGVYYNEGFNNKVCQVVEQLFAARLEQKKLGNPIEKQYKLILNSAYGRTLMKARPTEDKYITDDKKDGHLIRHYNSIRRFYPCGHNTWKFVHTVPMITHTNYVHCGVNVLSMSKQIMMEATALLEDIGGEVYYTDTDSCIIARKFFKPLEEAFMEKYDREFDGPNMQQFNNDYSMDVTLKDGSVVEADNVHAKRGWFLGKKLYTCHIVGTHPETKEEHTNWHVRGKGFPTSSIHHHCDTLDIDPGELAQRVFDGSEQVIDCLNDGGRVSFEYLQERTVRSRRKMTRTMRCVRN